MANSPNGLGNAIELKVVLGVNDTASKGNLNAEIAKLQSKLDNVKIDIKIDPKAITALERLATLDFSKLTQEVGKIGKETKKLATVSANEYEKAMKMAAEKTKINFGSAIRGSAADIKFIENKLKGMNATLDVKFDTKNGEKHLKSLQTSIENNGITQKVKFEQVMVSDGKESRQLWMPKTIQDTNRQMSNAVKSTDDLIARMNKLQTEGKITNQQFEHLTSTIGGISGKAGLARVNQQMDEMVASTKRQNAEIIEQERHQKKLIDNEIKRKNLIIDIERAMKSQSKNINQASASSLLAQTKALDVSSESFGRSIANNRTGLRQLNADATTASRNNMGIINSFKTAMEKFPIWMAASTLFYGTVRTASEFARIIIDIDTKMVNLTKVMSEGTNFEALFDRATQSAERFGQSISHVLDSYTEFARQGFKGDELGVLADAGLVASNVGEITAQKASEYMTASLIQWKMDAKDAMGIIDSWNEISNNYATTTEKLAQGQARAGATARAMGLDFDQLNAIVGTVTASTKQSGNEIGNFVKSVLPRLVGQPAQDAMASLGVNLTDSKGNLRDIIEVYTEIAERVKDISDSERISVVEGLAGKYHISRMQALLDDLGSANSMYKSMYESSTNSTGSAMDENEKYMKSLQARINLARVEVEKLALAFGEAFLTEGMISGIKAFGEFLGAATKLTEAVGALPVVLGVASLGLALMSTRFRALMISVGEASTAFVKFGATSARSVTTATPAIAAQTTAINVMSTSALRASVSMDRMSLSTYATSGAARVLGGTATTASLGVRAMGSSTTVAALSANTATVSLRALAVSFRGLLMTALPIGIAFAAIGFITEKLLSKQQEQRKLQEEIASENKQLAESYAQNSERISELATKYDELQTAIKNNEVDPDTMKEYVEVQNELAELLPSLKKGETEHGDAILGSASIVKQRIDLLTRQAEAQERVNAAAEIEKREKAYASAVKEAEDSQSDAEDFKPKQRSSSSRDRGTGNINFYTEEIDTIEDLQLAVKSLAEEEKRLVEGGVKENAVKLGLIRGEMEFYDEQLASYTSLQTGMELAHTKVLNAALQKSDAMLASDEKVSASAKSLMNTFATTAASAISDSSQLTSFFDEYYNAIDNPVAIEALDNYGKAFDTLKQKQAEGLSTDDLIEYKTEAVRQLDIVKEQFSNLLSGQDITQEKTPEIYNQMMSVFGQLTPKIDETSTSIADLAVEFSTTEEEMRNALAIAASMGDGMGGVESSVDEADQTLQKFIETLGDYASANEAIAGVSQKQIDNIEELIYVYRTLSSQTVLTADQTRLLKEAQESLAQAYPHLVKNGNIRIDNIEAERVAQSNLLKMVDASKKGQLTAEELKTLGQLLATNARIKNINAEIAAIEKLATAYSGVYEATKQAALKGDASAGLALMRMSVPIAKFKSLQAELASATANTTGLNKDVASAVDRVANSTKSGSKASKSANKATQDSIYITDKYKQSLERLNFEIDKQQSIQKQFPAYSKKHQDSLKAEIVLQEKKLKLTQAEAASLSKQINSRKIAQTGSTKGKYDSSSQAVDEAKSELLGLQSQILDFQETINDLSMTAIESQLAGFNQERQSYQRVLDFENEKIQSLDETSTRYAATIQRQALFLGHKQAVNQKELNYLNNMIKSGKLSATAMDEMKIRAQELKTEMMSLDNEISRLSLENAQKVADVLIDSYKQYLEEKRDMHMDSLDDEMDAEDNRHKTIMDNYNKELDEYRDLVQEKLDLIEDEESDRDYGMEMDDLEEERLKTLNKINVLSIDDSFESKAERAKLKEELSQIDEDILEKQHDREVELRKENLNGLVTDKEKEIEESEKIEDKRHENEKTRIDELKEYWEQFYDDLINDERRFAEIKEQIVAGNYDALSVEFQEYIDEMEATMPSLENTLNGTMEAVGTSIRQNIVDRLKEALDLLGKVQKGTGSTGDSGGSTGGGSTPSASAISNPDLKVVLGKFMRERLHEVETNPVRQEYIREKAYELAGQGRKEGSTISGDVGFDSVITGFNKDQLKAIGEYFQKVGVNQVSTPYLQDYIREFGRKLMSASTKFDTGGFTGNDSGLAMLHEKELVLNKNQTQDILKSATIMERIQSFLSPLSLGKIQKPQLNNSKNGGDINIEFHVENMNGSKKDVDNFSKMIGDKLRREKGV